MVTVFADLFCLITISSLFTISNCCGPWVLATPSNLICTSGQFQYKYQRDANTYYLSPQTSSFWSWDNWATVTGTYQYTTNGGGSFSSFACNSGVESGWFGIGCSTGGGNNLKVLPAYIKNPNIATATVCQDTPGIFVPGCGANIEIYFRVCSGSCTSSPTPAPTASPSPNPTLSPTYKNCNEEGEIKNIDWNELQNNNDNSAQVPNHPFTVGINNNTLQLTFDIDLEYVGLSSDGNFDTNYNLGTTYVIDFQSFSTNGDFIDKPGNCQNRLASSFTGDFNSFWTFSEYAYLPDQIGSDSYLSYPPPSEFWTLSIVTDACTPVNYNGVFSWKELSECTDYDGNKLVSVVDDGLSISLSGTLYVNLVSPYSMGVSDTGMYRTFPLIQQDFEISILKQVNVLSSTGVELFIVSIIGVHQNEIDGSMELTVLTQSADYIELINPNVISSPLTVTSITTVTNGCLVASSYTCGQIFAVTIDESQINCPPADLSGDYILEFEVSCPGNEEVCNTFIVDNNGSIIALQVTSNFIDSTCEPELYDVIFDGEMTFYDDEQFSILHDNGISEYVIGQDVIYVEVEVTFPDDGTNDNFNIFEVVIDNVYVCTAGAEIDLNVNLDQQDGAGACLSGDIDPDGPYDIITNGVENSNYEAQTISSNGDSNVVQFSFLTFDVGRTTIYVHAQLTLLLQNGQRRRLKLLQVNENTLNDDNNDVKSDQIRHFSDSIGITSSTISTPKPTEINSAKRFSLYLSIFICFVVFVLY